jgi:hypothetical protein
MYKPRYLVFDDALPAQGLGITADRFADLLRSPLVPRHSDYDSLAESLAAIMHHVARFCTSVEWVRAGDPTGWIGVRQLAVQRVWG